MKGIMRKSMAGKRKFLAVVLATIMLVTTFSAAVEENFTSVIVVRDGIESVYETHALTVGEFFEAAELNVKANDIVNYDLAAVVEEGMSITWDVAKYITIHDHAGTYGAITYADTVEAVCADFNNPLGVKDTTYPERYERAYDGMVVFVDRAHNVTLTQEGSTITFETYSKTVGEFLAGLGVTVPEDKELSHSPETIIAEGMAIEIRNPKPKAMSPLDFGLDLSTARVITCEATAYTAAADECWPYADGYTATGVKCEVGVVAVDPRVIPLKSKLYIEAADGSFVYGYCTAEDTGGAIKGNKVDLAMNTKSDCFRFGRRQVKVYILS